MPLSQEKKIQLTELIARIMQGLNERNLAKIIKEIINLKKISGNLPQNLKDDIQDFIIQADIQKDYDIVHGVSPKLKQLADKLINDLKKS